MTFGGETNDKAHCMLGFSYLIIELYYCVLRNGQLAMPARLISTAFW